MADLTAGVLASNIESWHTARNLIDGSTDQAQFVKLMEEAGELAASIARGKDVRDDIGDMVVVLINIAKRNGYKLEDCMEVAWKDIRDRKGKMVDGVFIKEEDTPEPTSNVIPIDATHINNVGCYLKKNGKFWNIYVDDIWRVMSGDPVGEIISLTGEDDAL